MKISPPTIRRPFSANSVQADSSGAAEVSNPNSASATQRLTFLPWFKRNFHKRGCPTAVLHNVAIQRFLCNAKTCTSQVSLQRFHLSIHAEFVVRLCWAASLSLDSLQR